MAKSISLRFNLVTSGVVILLLIAFGAYNVSATQSALEHQLKAGINGALERLQESLPATLWNYETAQTQRLVRSEMASENVAGIAVFDDKGKLVLGRGKADDGSVQDIQSLPSTGGFMREAPLVFDNNGDKKTVGKVQILADESGIAKLQRESLIRQTLQLVILVAILIGAVSLLLRQMVIRPIRQVSEALNDIAQGEGDLTRRLDVSRKDEIGSLAANFNQFVEQIRDIVSRVIGSVGEISSSINNLQDIASRTRDGVETQQGETDQVATAMTEMSSTAQSVAESAENAAASARKADEQGQVAHGIVSEAIASIDGLAKEIEGGTHVIADLEKNVGEITSVLAVIRGIAEQTNLLALNAAIEAARAGEQGRGFAVVADEVRALASRTQSSTEEIQSMISRLEAGAKKAVDVMNSSKVNGERTVGQANKAGEALYEVSQAVAVINEMNTQIASAAEEQTAVAEDISSSLERIVEIADRTSADTSETQTASQHLRQLAEKLGQLVSHFSV